MLQFWIKVMYHLEIRYKYEIGLKDFILCTGVLRLQLLMTTECPEIKNSIKKLPEIRETSG